MGAVEPPLSVTDEPERGRYVLLDGQTVVGQARYVTAGPDRVVFFHTEVDEAYGGRGLAGELAAHALDGAVANGKVIVPVCPYIARYVERHPESYADHVSAPRPDDLAAVRKTQRR